MTSATLERPPSLSAPLSRAATQPTWRSLLRGVAVGTLAVLLGMAGFQTDTLAASLAAIVVLGLALTWSRLAWAGQIVLALVFADLTWYTLSGAISNLLNREGLGPIALPVLLASLSVAGLISAAAALVQHGNPAAGGLPARLVAGGAGAFFVLMLGVSAVLGQADRQARAGEITLATEEMAFSATTLQAPADSVTLRLDNHDLFWHTFSVGRLGVDLKVPVGGSRSVTFNAAPGTYVFYCSIPTHDLLGMKGTLIVQ